jgi:hypothetical protein
MKFTQQLMHLAAVLIAIDRPLDDREQLRHAQRRFQFRILIG